MQKDKNFLPHISCKNAACIVPCSKHQWSQITSRVNLGVKCLNVNNIKRQISHTCVLDRILESGSVGQHIILLFSLKGKKPHIRAHSEIADKTSSLLPVPLTPHIEKNPEAMGWGEAVWSGNFSQRWMRPGWLFQHNGRWFCRAQSCQHSLGTAHGTSGLASLDHPGKPLTTKVRGFLRLSF